MITIRKSSDRGHRNHGWLDTRHSFSFGGYQDPEHMGFRSLRVLNEDWVQATKGFPTHGHANMEIITYMVEGTLVHRDSTGSSSKLRPGDVQVMSAGSGITHSEFNASNDEELHLLQIWLVPEQHGVKPTYAEKHFSDESKRGQLRAIASPEGRSGSLEIGQDAAVYASVLDAGDSLSHPLGHDRHAWLQVVRGRLSVGAETLEAGDGAAISGEARVEIVAEEAAEFLLFDLA